MEVKSIRYEEDNSKLRTWAIALLEETFPRAERRDSEDFERLLITDSRLTLYLLSLGNELCGVITIWQLDGCFYCEHFAIHPSFRNKGIGASCLLQIKNRLPLSKNPLLLEVELPTDTQTRRRINFYERNGFRIVDTDYIQPSYGGGRPELPMFLMATETLSPDEVRHCVKEIRSVYPLPI